MSNARLNGRVPRGRGRNRPCDFCRERKTACQMADEPPCRKCFESSRPCTFARGVPRRGQRVIPSQSTIPVDIDASFPALGADTQNVLSPLPTPIPWFDTPEIGFDLSSGDVDWQNFWATSSLPEMELDRRPRAGVTEHVSSETRHDPMISTHVLTDEEGPPEETEVPTFPMLLGLTSEMDPLLRLRYQFDNSSRFKSQFRQFKQVDPASDLPQLMVLTPRQPCLQMSPSMIVTVENSAIEKLSAHHDQLLSLFFQFVQPIYPVAERTSATAELGHSKAYLTGIYLHALEWRSFDPTLPWVLFDPKSATRRELPDKQALHRVVWDDLLGELHAPTYGTLQAILLHIERARSSLAIASTPFDLCLPSMAVTIALSLGLNQNCENWNLTHEEKAKRNTLWWAVYVQDAWINISNGQMPKIREGDYDTARLWHVPAGSDAEHPTTDDLTSHEYSGFCLLILLARILRLIYDTLFRYRDLRAAYPTPKSCETQINDLRDQLFRWKSAYDKILANRNELNPETRSCDTGSLRIAYLYCLILLHRAAFRLHGNGSGRIFTHNMATDFASDLLKQLQQFDLATFEGFWFSWSVGHFNAIGDFMFHLYVSAPTKQVQDAAVKTLQKYRSWLWSRSKAFEITRMSLIRLDSLMRSDKAGTIRKDV